jgi:hypothetical protein
MEMQQCSFSRGPKKPSRIPGSSVSEIKRASESSFRSFVFSEISLGKAFNEQTSADIVQQTVGKNHGAYFGRDSARRDNGTLLLEPFLKLLGEPGVQTYTSVGILARFREIAGSECLPGRSG